MFDDVVKYLLEDRQHVASQFERRNDAGDVAGRREFKCDAMQHGFRGLPHLEEQIFHAVRSRVQEPHDVAQGVNRLQCDAADFGDFLRRRQPRVAG